MPELTFELEGGEGARFDVVGHTPRIANRCLRYGSPTARRKGQQPYMWQPLPRVGLDGAANFGVCFELAIQRWCQCNAARKPRLVVLKAVAHKLAHSGRNDSYFVGK